MPDGSTSLLFCSGCQSAKSPDQFSRHKNRSTGRGNWCKACMRRIYTRPDYLERRKAYRTHNLSRSLLIETRARAKRRGIEFDLNVADLVVPEACPVLGIRLVAQGKRTDASPTVDRIDQSRGYIKGNVAVVSWLANRLKSNCSDPAIFEAIAAYLRRRL